MKAVFAPEERVAQHFNRCAHSYVDGYRARSATGHFFRRRQEIILSQLERFDRGRLLDVGCGPGLMAEPCLDMGFSFSGIDISEAMIAECRKRCMDKNYANFLVGNLQSLPFPGAMFDVVLCMGALEYVAVNEQPRAIAEIGRVTRSDGLLILSCLNKSSPYWMFYDHVYARARQLRRAVGRIIARVRDRNRFDNSASGDVAMQEFSEQSCRRLLETHGFVVVDTFYYGMNLLVRPLDKQFPRLAARASEKLEYLSEGRLRWLAMAFIIVARKEAAGCRASAAFSRRRCGGPFGPENA